MDDALKYIKTNFFRIVGILLTAISVVYLGQILYKEGGSIRVATNWGTFFYAILILLAYVVINIITATIWRLILAFISDNYVESRPVYMIYFKSNIAKYLPGNVFHYVGRNIMGSRLGWSHLQLAFSSVLEIILSVSLPLLIVATMLFLGIAHIPLKLNLNVDILVSSLVFVLPVLCLSAVLFFFTKSYWISHPWFIVLKSNISQILSLKFVFLLVKCTFLASISMYMNVLVFYGCAIGIMGLHWALTDFFTVASLLCIAGFSGILTPGVPGGIGVKETLSMMLLTSVGFVRAELAAVLILFRIGSILGEAICYLYSLSIIIDKK